MSNDDPSAVRRAHREKRMRDLAGGIDGGAIAVGVVVPLAGFAPILVFAVPTWLAAAVLGSTLFLGGFLTSSITAANARCPGCHGAIVGVCTAIVIGGVVLADGLADSDTVSLDIVHIAASEPTTAFGTTVAGVLIAGIGGVIGSR